MSSRILPVSVLLILLHACSVVVDRGPFPIEEDTNLAAGKHHYLETVREQGVRGRLPNIVLILADDLGKHDISTYDPAGVPTPALDRLAAGGVQYHRAYASSPVCSPSRAGLLTGRYQQRFGYERQPMNRYPRNRMEYWFVDHFVSTDPMSLLSPMSRPDAASMQKQGLPASEILLPELLLARGYRTGIFGKWHLGFGEEFLPHNRGFEEQFGFYEAFTYYYPPGTKGMEEHRHDYFASKHIWRQKRKGSSAIRVNDQVVEDTAYLTFSIADKACAFMEAHRDEPFFLYVPFSAPHTPFQVPLEYYMRFPQETDHNKRVYAGMISALDDAVGQILDQLKALGLEENTLVIFTSDNGGATYTGATDNGPLKAGKFTQFEGGVQVPLLLSMPGTLPAGQHPDYPVSQMDLFHTCVNLAGLALAEDREYDGMDLLAGLMGGAFAFENRTLFWRCEFNKGLTRGAWKFLLNERDNQVFLYRLDQDPGEEKNLAGAYPQLTGEFRELLQEWESGLMDPLWPGVMEFNWETGQDTTHWAI